MTFAPVFRRGFPATFDRNTAAVSNGLLNNLIFYLPLNEASGNALDAHSGGKTFTHVNDPGRNTGLVYPTARECLYASNEGWYRNNEADLQTGNIDWTVSFWIYAYDFVDYRAYVAKYQNIDTKREYIILCNATNIYLQVYNGTSMLGFAATPIPSTNVWTMITAHHNASASQIGIQKNNDSIAYGPLWGDMAVTDCMLDVARSGGYGCPYAGRMQSVAFWKSAIGGGGVLTAAQRASLYNDGLGLAYTGFTT